MTFESLRPFVPFLVRCGVTLVAFATPAAAAVYAHQAVTLPLVAGGFLTAATTYVRWRPDASMQRLLDLVAPSPDATRPPSGDGKADDAPR